MFRRVAVLVLIAVAAPACGSSPTSESPELVSVVADWQCDRQRFAFDSLDEMDALLEEILAESGISAEAFAAFEAEMVEDDALRDDVREAYDTTCG